MHYFLHPLYFILLILIPLLVYFDNLYYKKKSPKISFPNVGLLKEVYKRNSIQKYIPIILKSLALLFIITALARPRHTLQRVEYTTYGIDIILCIDVSGSMRAVDFRPLNRMEAAREVARDFINRRTNDRIGIVIFATYAHTVVPLTNDFSVLNHAIDGISIPVTQDATAIGNGIAISTLRLMDSPAESRVIIMLTDGEDNSSTIHPLHATEIAASLGIKVYAVGIGSHGPVPFPFRDARGNTVYRNVEIAFNMQALHDIARLGGTYPAVMATNTAELEAIFQQIDLLERTEVSTNITYEHREMFMYLLYIAAGLLALLVLLRSLFNLGGN
jgi:Ca-activated chloride channel family protein